MRIFHSEAWERIAVVKVFPIYRRATQLSIAAVFEGEHWYGSYTAAGLGTKCASRSGINKTVSGFNSGYTCPCLKEVLGKEVDIALFITSRRHVRNYLFLLSLLANSLCLRSSHSGDQDLDHSIFRF